MSPQCATGLEHPSIRALKVLGNTHCDLSMANWRLVFNVVCLLVLSYGSQLWATSHKYASLIKKVLYGSLPSSGVAIINVAGTISNQGQFNDLMISRSATMLTTLEVDGGETQNWTRHWVLAWEWCKIML